MGIAPSASVGAIASLQPYAGSGHQFVIYGDSCSGIPGGRHEETLARINAVVSRLSPVPDFVGFLGDEIEGLTQDAEELRRQWSYWRNHEMAWIGERTIPLYNTTGNHTTFDDQSENVFREMLPGLPQNGPAEQKGLSYFVRRDSLLLVFVNTLWSGFGMEGHVETDWLERTLSEYADAPFKLVLGHHPVFPANGNSGPYQRTIEPSNGEEFWRILVKHGVAAYLCSHMLAFDVQVHQGVLQIMTAGAGTAPLMPPEHEYHHAVQMAIDDGGLQYQVLDELANVGERLSWPLPEPESSSWRDLGHDEARPGTGQESPSLISSWKVACQLTQTETRAAQTLLAGWHDAHGFAPVWCGIVGREPFLAVLLTAERGRSPHLWRGPAVLPGEVLEGQLCLHQGMGAGGVLWRANDAEPWTSMAAASAWGPGQIPWPTRWAVGHGPAGMDDRPFLGRDLAIRARGSETAAKR